MTELTTTAGWPLVALNDDGIRPAGKPDECFYCRQPVGQPHTNTCVIVHKRVRLRYIFDVDIDIPHAWTKEDVEFHRNESSWCADNAIGELEHQSKDGCLCSRFTAEYMGILDETPTRKLTT